MQYQKALVRVLAISKTSIQELAEKMESDPRWVAEITYNPIGNQNRISFSKFAMS